MRSKTRLWGIIVLGLFVLAGVGLWQLSERPHQQRVGRETETLTATPKVPATNAVASAAPILYPPHLVKATASTNFSRNEKSDLPYRLSNTRASVDRILRNPRAILLQNALIDTESAAAISIPEHLRAKEDPSAYIVQAKGNLNDKFRSELSAAEANIISYVPNNAYLVRVTAGGAKRIANSPLTQSVLPFEPYYKLDPGLLEYAGDKKPLPAGEPLLVTGYPGEGDKLRDRINQLGLRPVRQMPLPFGDGFVVLPLNGSADTLIALAQSPAVQGIERHPEKIVLNDLARVRMGISADSLATTTNHLGLTGSNVWVNINDTGVDASHPDLTNRVFVGAFSLPTDTEGHGTHVAGTIASSGLNSPVPATNAPGSTLGASFRGMADGANLLAFDFSLPDTDLQELPARTNYLELGRTNVLISNNSWGYNGAFFYNSPSASFDAAVRDAIPGVTGPQPMLFVFAAGNSGNGSDNGSGGTANRITAPATAKNVITVGSLESPRNITNQVIRPNEFGVIVTNREFLGMTDSSNQVVFSSSRGNTGVNLEGEFGRFKPDVVAPGTFTVSTRSQQWDTNAYYNPTNIDVNFIEGFVIEPGETNSFSLFVPENATGIRIQALANNDSPVPFPALLIFTNFIFDPLPSSSGGNFAGTNSVSYDIGDPGFAAGTVWFYDIVNTNSEAVNYDLRTAVLSTNDYGNFFDVLRELDDNLGSSNGVALYRFETGTSMAAPVVSGMLALIQQYFQQQGPAIGLTNPSPALLKAMLINSARAAGPLYTTLNTREALSIQGWGAPDLKRVLPETGLSGGPILLFDQSETNLVGTDQTVTRYINVSSNAATAPMRVTLVWTDPPGNPAASVKLVNDLDLVVTNLTTGDVYYGNNFGGNGEFSGISLLSDTNGVVVINDQRDVVNNVENVYLSGPLGSSYSISVVGRRVNVNAVTTQTNGIQQDFALVISSGDTTLLNPFSVSSVAQNLLLSSKVTVLTNGVPLMTQKVGANSPLLTSTNGSTNQWNFYVLENTNGFTNVAFATFLPQDLSGTAITGYQVPTVRNLEADIDLYVSTDSRLTNLHPAAIAAADKSIGRGGTEFIIYTNAITNNAIYYVGVKSEDQRGAEYSFFGIASQTPFAQQNQDGSTDIIFVPVPTPIPDGTPSQPGIATVLGFSPSQDKIRRAIVTTVQEHQLFGDLVAGLSHNGKFVILNNHSFPLDDNGNTIESGIATNIYNDLDEGDFPTARPSDGPGSLRNFVGEQAAGLWLLTLQDNAPSHVGTNLVFSVRTEPQETNDSEGYITRQILGNRFAYDFIDVPAEATNLIVEVQFVSPAAGDQVEVYVRKNDIPTRTIYDKKAIFNPPGGILNYGSFDSPPLTAGRYMVGLYNPGATTITIRYRIRTESYVTPAIVATGTMTNSVPIIDDAVTNSVITVTNEGIVASVEVGVRIDHPRVSDLSLHLTSPEGTRVLLFENRGGLTTNGLGVSQGSTTNYVTVFQSGFETNAAGDYTNTVDGWVVQTNLVTVSNAPAVANSGNQLLSLRLGSISRSVPTVAGRNYRGSYAARRALPLDPVSWWKAENDALDAIDGNNGALQGSLNFVAGLVGQAFNFDGVDDHIVVTAATNLNVTSLTMETWIFPSEMDRNMPLFEFGVPSGYGGVHFWMNHPSITAGLFANVRDVSGTDHGISTVSGVIRSNEWNHVALTFDQTSGDCRLYANGVAVAGANFGVVNPRTSQDLYLGYRSSGSSDSMGGSRFHGQMDEPAFFSRALSAAEILEIYNAGAAGKCGTAVPPTPCVGTAGVVLEGISSNLLTVTTNWTTNTFAFTAVSNGMNFQFTALSSGILLDDIFISEENTNGTLVYTVFTENTNRFPQLLKFATPPYGTNTIGTNFAGLTNSFETVGASNYSVGATIEGWTIVSSNVTVYADTNSAADGTNFVSLYSTTDPTNVTLGAIQQSFSAGRIYTMNFEYRRPDSSLINWWPGEDNGIDVMTGDAAASLPPFVNGKVGRAFYFTNNHDGPICGTTPGIFGTNDFTIEFWIATTDTQGGVISKRQNCNTNDLFEIRMADSGTGQLQFEAYSDASGNNPINFVTTGTVNNGAFHHVAFRRQGTNITAYIDGVLSGSTTSVGITDLNSNTNVRFGRNPCRSAFTGVLDEIGFHRKAISLAEIVSIYQAGSLGRIASINPPHTNAPTPAITITAPGSTNTYVASTTNWTLGTFTFVGSDVSNVVKIACVTNGVWIDNISIEGVGAGQFYYPEESLNLFVGEQAAGDWTLEIWDTRGGAAIGTALLGWELNLTLARDPDSLPNPPIPLEHGVPVTNTVYTNDIIYFMVDVPAAATYATNTLISITGGQLDLLFNQNGLPLQGAPGDFTLLSGTSAGISTLTTTGPAPLLQPGQRYYLGVRNTTPTETNTFSLQVDFDALDATNLNVTPLTNSLSLFTNIVAGNALDYFQYDVSSNAVAVYFEILNPDGNVDLYARYGAPLPNTGSYDYRSINSGTNNELIAVGSTSFPVALTPGRWYLGVYNRTTNTVNYAIRATEQLPVGSGDIIDLINKVPTNGVVQPSPAVTNYYRFTITNNSAAALFELYGLDGNADLLLRRDTLPNLAEYDYSSIRVGTNHEYILIDTNDLFTDLNGDWCLAVINKETNVVNFTIKASLSDPGVLETNTVETNNIIYFVIDVPPTATFATNVLTSISGGPLDLLFNQTAPPGIGVAGDYTLLSATTGGTNVLTGNGPAPQLLSGARYVLGVRNTNPTETNTFELRVDFSFDDPASVPVTPLTNAVSLATNITSGNAAQYFYFDVSTNATVATFEILNANGNVDLYARYDLPLPDFTTYDYRSINSGTNDETIFVMDTSTPVALTPGRWYFAVYNNEPRDVAYEIRATEQYFNIIDLTDGVPVTAVSPPGLPGTNFFRFVISDSSPSALFELYGLNGNVDLLLRRDGFPSLAQFDYASQSGGLTNEQIVLRTNISLLDINGTWLLAVPNNDALDVDFTIRASVTTNQMLISGLPLMFTARPIILPGGNIQLQWNSVAGETYQVQGSTTLTSWSTLTTIVASGVTTVYVTPFVVSDNPYIFFRIVQLPTP